MAGRVTTNFFWKGHNEAAREMEVQGKYEEKQILLLKKKTVLSLQHIQKEIILT